MKLPYFVLLFFGSFFFFFCYYFHVNIYVDITLSSGKRLFNQRSRGKNEMREDRSKQKVKEM